MMQYNSLNVKLWNDEIEDIIKIIKSLEDSGLLLESFMNTKYSSTFISIKWCNTIV